MNDQLTFDDLRAYQAGLLSNSARYRVERLLLENPFYADALAGLEALQQTTTAGRPTAGQIADLREALHQRIHESATPKRLWPLWIATTTAAILFMIAIAIYFIFFAHKQPAQPKLKPTRAVMVESLNSIILAPNFVRSHQRITAYSADRVKHLPKSDVNGA